MIKVIKAGDCLKLSDGIIGRVRNSQKRGYRVRVARKNSKSPLWLTVEDTMVIHRQPTLVQQNGSCFLSLARER